MRLKIALIALVLAVLPGLAPAASKLDQRVSAATEVLQQMNRMPEQAIPESLMRNAYAVAVIPGVIKAGLLIGGSFGQGVLVVRQPDGHWSNPAFISMGGGSFGWQVGAQSSDIVLVFKSRKGVDNIAQGKLTLGADANVAAGPVGRHTSAATDARLSAEIYSYARNRGLFAGVSLEGKWIGMDDKANTAYYDAGQITAPQILSDPNLPTPAAARQFVATLTAQTPQVERNAATTRTAAAEPGAAPERESTAAKTYGLDDAPAADGDTIF